VRKFVWPVIAVVIAAAQLYLLLDTKSASEVYVPVAGTSTTTTTFPGSSITTPWGSLASDSFRIEEIDTCKDFTFDLQVTDLAPIGDPNKFVQIKGTSGFLFAVTGATLKVGSNPVTFTLCRREEEQWRTRVETPWRTRDFTVKSFPKCPRFFVDSLVEGESLQLITSCPAVK
jgi:hypothetical protein